MIPSTTSIKAYVETLRTGFLARPPLTLHHPDGLELEAAIRHTVILLRLITIRSGSLAKIGVSPGGHSTLRI